jgi:APA family basic amino acid/polyamine antiporter
MTAGPQEPPRLVRGVGLAGATALNMIDMIGVGPFITIPIIISVMGGPQAMLGWVIGAMLVICDGLVWAELGAALPGSGGSYRFLREIYGRDRLGRMMSFLFIWQLTFSAPLSIASGCIGLSQYAGYLLPALGREIVRQDLSIALPLLGSLTVSIVVTPGTFLAMASCIVAVLLLYRKISAIGWLSKFLWVGVMLTIGWIIASGVSHFNSARAFDFPPGAFSLSANFFNGLGAGMLVAVYDYWGYYNVCFLGDEIKDPGRTIPRAILASILLVAVIYIVMNVSILGVIPWRELTASASSDAHRFVIAAFMERLYGPWAGSLVTVLIIWTAFASVFSLLLGYSRIPYAAANDGNFFRPFGRVHPRHNIPHVSLIVLGFVALFFCMLRLADVIAALVVIRIMIQFLAQTVGVIVLRVRRPDLERPFRMWLYPLPAVAAFAGFLYVLVMRHDFLKEIKYGVVIIVGGSLLYLIKAYRQKEWPFIAE